MVVNIYDTANELERQMRETQEYQDLQAAFAKLKADSDAFELFKKFQQSQMQAQQKQMAGQELSEDEIKAVQDLAKEVGQKQSVIALMEVERRVDNMMQELNKVITKPIQDIYQDIMPQKQNWLSEAGKKSVFSAAFFCLGSSCRRPAWRQRSWFLYGRDR